MRLSVAALPLLALATAKTIQIQVGQSGLSMSPSTVQASKGDVLEFHFDGAHSVAMGDFTSPCEPAKEGGFYSGIQSAGKDTVFQVTVNSTDPIFYYCTVPGHCQSGMVGAINPTSDMTLSKFMDNAKSTETTGSPKAVSGGVFAKASSGSSSTAGGGTAYGMGSSSAASNVQALFGGAGALGVALAALAL